MKKRESNYDLLRIISAVAVIMIHVSTTWFNSVADHSISFPFIICVYNSISRFAVPCFLMLSGAFLLDNEQNLDYKNFYVKSFAKIGVPTVIFSILYIIYRLPICFISEERSISSLLIEIIQGSPMYHMWYLYMLIGIYALVPVLLRYKNSISENTFYKVSFIFLVLASISRWTTGEVRLNWSVGQSFEYLGYFMTGYSIRKISRYAKPYKAVGMVVSGLLLEICAAGLEYQIVLNRIATKNLKLDIVSPYSPLIVLASVLIFWGFASLELKSDFSRLSDMTFLIYLVHAGVWHFISNIFVYTKGRNFLTSLNGVIWILVFVVIVFVISCFLSKLYLWIWCKANKEERITKFLIHIVHLDR